MSTACKVLDFPSRLSWNEIKEHMRGSHSYIDGLSRLSLEQLNNLIAGAYDAPKELVEAAHNLQGCEWLG